VQDKQAEIPVLFENFPLGQYKHTVDALNEKLPWLHKIHDV
jgi:hypothetical protein